MVFSDYMYKYDSRLNKKKVILLITDEHAYIMEPTRYNVLNSMNLNALQDILII